MALMVVKLTLTIPRARPGDTPLRDPHHDLFDLL